MTAVNGSVTKKRRNIDQLMNSVDSRRKERKEKKGALLVCYLFSFYLTIAYGYKSLSLAFFNTRAHTHTTSAFGSVN
jgi:hypothetical protein